MSENKIWVGSEAHEIAMSLMRQAQPLCEHCKGPGQWIPDEIVPTRDIRLLDIAMECQGCNHGRVMRYRLVIDDLEATT